MDDSRDFATCFALVWCAVVVSVLTVFGLCKISGHLFSMPAYYVNSKEEYYNLCLKYNGTSDAQKCQYVLQEVK